MNTLNRPNPLAELVDLFEDPRSNAQLIESGPLYVLADLLCKGAMKLPDGSIELVDRHRIRFLTRPEFPNACLTVYEPDVGVPFHPNIRSEPPFIICSDLENQIARRGLVPLVSSANLVFDIISGNDWAADHGIFNSEALKHFADAQATGQLPFDTRRLI